MTTKTHAPRHVYRNIYRSSKPPTCILDREDLASLFDELESKVREGVQLQLANATRPADQSVEEFEDLKARALESATLSVFIYGADGEQVFVQSAEDLRTQRLPNRIESVTYDSASVLRTIHNWEPDNRFKVVLDFTEPPGFDKYNPLSGPTPNGSQIEVNGTNSTWVAGVHESILAFLRARAKKRGWLHDHGVYNLYNWLVAIPASLWVAYRIAEAFESNLTNVHVALRGALYIYLFLVMYLVARGIAVGFRWLFPLMEFRGSRSKSVRVAVGAVLTSLITALLYDVLRAIVF